MQRGGRALGRLGLRFSAAHEAEHPGIEDAFRDEHGRGSLVRVRAVAGLLVIVYLAYIPATIAFEFGQAFPLLPHALALETFGLLVTLLFLAFSYRPGFPRAIQGITGFTAACLGAQASAVSLLFPHPFDYVALCSVILLLMCVYTVLRLRFVAATATGWAILAAFTIEAITIGDLGRDPAIQLGVYLATANLIGMAAAYWIERTLRHDFLQTRRLARERERAERLLLNVLPPSIAARLKAGEEPIADSLPAATVLFADIVGFTPLASRLPAEEVVAVLNELFSRFDALVTALGLEKIKTIGDAYMVAGGVPEAREDHAAAVAQLALSMRAAVVGLNAERGWGLGVRIGIHSGPLVAGVIGRRRFSYDVWGDTVNTASRMESHGEPERIQVSEATFELLRDTFTLEPRGELPVKGKGLMRTYFLVGPA